MQLCISQATILPSGFADDISALSGVGWTAVEVWLTKLEKHLEITSLEDTQRLLAERQIRPVAAAYQGGLLISRGEQRKAHFDHYRKRLELCQIFGITTLLVASDHSRGGDCTAWQLAAASLAQAAQWAAGFGVRLALEFRGHDAFCTSLDSALDLIETCGEPNVGVCLDVFHFYKGPSKNEDLQRLTKENVAFVQLCDVAGMPRELMTDSDRVFPGDGDFKLTEFLNELRRIGYDGYVSLELMNPTLWQMKPSQVAELGLMALRRIVTPEVALSAEESPTANLPSIPPDCQFQ